MWTRGGGQSVEARLRERPSMEWKEASLSIVCSGGAMLAAKRLKQRRKGEMAAMTRHGALRQQEVEVVLLCVGGEMLCSGRAEGMKRSGRRQEQVRKLSFAVDGVGKVLLHEEDDLVQKDADGEEGLSRISFDRREDDCPDFAPSQLHYKYPSRIPTAPSNHTLEKKKKQERSKRSNRMLEESLPSILASVYGWFTPAVLFVLLNLVIGSIAVASKSSGADGHHHQHQSGPEADDDGRAYPGRSLSRSPSVVLDCLRSFNIHRYCSGEIPPPFEPAPTTRAEVLYENPNPVVEAEDEQQQHFGRSQSDVQPTAGEMPPKLPVRIKKSAFAHLEEAEAEGSGGGAEVDARADDFINRFRQQLRLQRLESIARYKEGAAQPPTLAKQLVMRQRQQI
ncbi:hypothetical protein BHE74_00031708 [Ensete ventricosum]|nr:hypothetical protein BHE74_00031708 [Ensete ventricosum]